MKRNITKHIYILFVITLIAGCAAANAADLKLTARVNTPKIGINETLQYILSVEGASRINKLPQPPDFKHFDVVGTSRSSNMQIINGRVQSSFNMVFRLVPKDVGRFTIGKGTFTHKGKKYYSNTVEVEVLQGEKKPPQQAPHRTAPSLDPYERDQGITDNVFLKTSVDKKQAVINEPVTLTFGFYSRINLSSAQIEQMPTLSGFWKEELQESRDQRAVIVDGRRYNVDEWKWVVFPTTTGDFVIDEAKVRVQTSPFQSPYILKSNPIKITVRDFPEEGRPENFSGAVGDFRMKTTLAAGEVKANEPVDLTVRIYGRGNVNSIPELVVDLPPDIDVYESKSSSNTFHEKDHVHGERIFEYALLPRAPGEYTLPAIEFTFYNYRTGEYETASSGPMALKVTGMAGMPEAVHVDKDTVRVLKREINHIKPAPEGGLGNGGILYKNRAYLLLHLLPLLALAGAFAVKRRREIFRRDVALARSTRAKGVAGKRLRRASKLMSVEKQKEFFTALSAALYEYFGDKLNAAPGSLVADDVIHRLRDKLDGEVPENEIRECLATCDTARFSTFGVSHEEMKKAYDQAAGIINTLERQFKRAG